MSAIIPFDLLSVPLSGTHLIEASAGTGKTFTITNLVLRLVAEEGLDIGRILAVTFTEAATKELRMRIRDTLNRARFLVNDPDSEENPAAAVVARAVAVNGRPAVSTALRKAALSFDEAGIFTIHGFCNRVLNQFAFESSQRFNTELVTDQSRLVQEVVDDFWRRTFGRQSRLFCAAALRRGLSPDGLAGFSRILLNKPTVQLVPDTSADAPANLRETFDAVRRQWTNHRDRIMDLLYQHPGLSRGRGAYHPDSLAAYAAGLDRICDNDVDPEILAIIERFTPETLETNLKPSKKGEGVPDDLFFDRCREYVSAEKAAAVYYRHDFRRFLERELSRRKHDRNVLYFSDLLVDLQRALASDSRGRLTAAIREKYQAVLIDEFQDTDPVQYDIFHTLFGAEGQRLFLIGDPKQSIFAFRSADVFSYIQASQRIPPERTYALPRNWRSETPLVEGVNRLFGRAENPFVLGDAIGFNPVTADPKNVGNRAPLTVDGCENGRLVLWFIGSQAAGTGRGTLNREQARRAAIDAVTAEIAGLLNRSVAGAARIGDKPVSPADIAVLITRNEDAGRVKDRLAALNIPAVVSRTGSVFTTPEATAVERVLLAMAAPTDTRRINAVLADDLIGCPAADIRGFIEDDDRFAEFETHLRRFAEYHQAWRSGGFIRVFRRFMADYHVRPRLLEYPDGERRLTNVLHLTELIHKADVNRRLGMNGLLEWIAERRAAVEETPDEEQLRLERDDEAVRIVTVWKSKGLQYPVVFCPFMWQKGAAVRDDGVLFHDDQALLLDIGGEDAVHARAAARENLSELVRLLYVAVTRAVNRCYLVCGKIGSPLKSGVTALDYVLIGGQPAAAVSLDELQDRIRDTDNSALCDRVAERLEGPDASIEVGFYEPAPAETFRPVTADQRELSPPGSFGADRLDQEWGIASFTRLTVRRRAGADHRDEEAIKRDEFPAPPLETYRVPAGTIFDFPAGPAAGLCIHSIFEQLDFSLADPQKARGLIDDALRRYGLDRRSPTGTLWHEVVFGMIRDVLQAPVLPHDAGFRLGALSAGRMITEMAFYYPVSRLTPGNIRALMRAFAVDGDQRQKDFLAGGERLQFRPLHGYMRGFIDLVFEHDGRYYLLDWKTNHLGFDSRDYDFAGLCRCVAEESYFLQYYIYTVALDRYLSVRLPDYDYETHFGGVVYLFVRGVDPDIPGNGVYFDRPSPAMTKRLNEVLG